MSKSVTLGLVATAALLLWGCGSDSDTSYPGTDTAGNDTIVQDSVGKGCPNGAVLAEASTITRLRPGGGKDPTDVILSAAMTKPHVSCDYDNDTRKLQVSLQLPFTAKRGPAATNTPETLSYFVAVVDLDNTVITKRAYSQEVSFGGQSAMSFDENIGDTVFDVAKGKKLVGYEVLVGFQLTRDELAYNRSQRRYMP